MQLQIQAKRALRLAGVFDNALRLRKALRRSYWRCYQALPGDFVFKGVQTPYQDLDLAGLPPAVALSLSWYNAGTEVRKFLSQEEYVLWCRKPLVMEPAYGWAILGPWLLLDQSLAYKYYLQPPALSSSLEWLRLGGRCQSAAPLLSLRDVGEGNYFHCYNDILAKLVLAEQAGLPRNLTVLVGHAMYEKPFFQELMSRGELRSRNWCVQTPTRHVACSSAYFLKTRPCSVSLVEGLIRMTNAPLPSKTSQDRVFIHRRSASGRNLLNHAEVAACFMRHSFQLVELENTSVQEQMEIFSRARYIAGIHGAGLVNIIFRFGTRTGILEMFPPNNIPPHYYWLSRQLCYDYSAVVGEGDFVDPQQITDFPKTPFSIVISDLENAIQRLLEK